MEEDGAEEYLVKLEVSSSKANSTSLVWADVKDTNDAMAYAL